MPAEGLTWIKRAGGAPVACRPMTIRRIGVAVVKLGQQRCRIDAFFVLQFHWFAF
jgi:hypothetical protein